MSASGWSILFSAMTVGNFSSTNALTTFSIVSLDQCSRGSFNPSRSRQRATTVEVLPYPENWVCSVSTALASDGDVSICAVDEAVKGWKLTYGDVPSFDRTPGKEVRICIVVRSKEPYHFSIKFPCTHRTISERNHAMS